MAYSGSSWLCIPHQTQEGGHCLSPNFLKNPFSPRYLIRRVPVALEAVALPGTLAVHLGALKLGVSTLRPS